MAKKSGSSSAELYQQLLDSQPLAESAVVESAISFCDTGRDVDLRSAVDNLNQIRAAVNAMAKIAKKSGKSTPAIIEPEPVSKAAD
jgi:hypothetical protein